MVADVPEADIALECKVLKAFLLPNRAGRYCSLVRTKKGRQRFCRRMFFPYEVNPRFVREAPGRHGSKAEQARLIARALEDLGSPANVYVISQNGDLDGRELPLHEVLDRVVGGAANDTCVMHTRTSCLL